MKNCTANVCINKGRVKTYGDKVYLSDGQEYSIELFNGTRTKKMAKIYLDGKLISTSGLVLKPGQRVFLERFIDDSRKFKFSTYTIDSSKEAKEAIENNGDLKVEFYDEKVPYYFNQDFYLTSNCVYYSNVDNFKNFNTTYDSNFTNCLYNNNYSSNLRKNSLETGTTEKGSISNQSFAESYDTFNTWVYQTINYKILPLSYKPIEIQDTLLYCTKCSNKQKKGQIYCPKCGTKYE